MIWPFRKKSEFTAPKTPPAQKTPIIFEPENQYIIIYRLVAALNQSEFLKKEGFFRISPETKKRNAAVKALAENPNHADLPIAERENLIGILKYVIQNPPLLSLEEGTRIVNACQPDKLNAKNISDVMKKEIDEIMPIEKRTAIFQIFNLMTKVVEKSAENSMTDTNVMIVMGKTLFTLELDTIYNIGVHAEQLNNLAPILNLIEGKNPWADMLEKNKPQAKVERSIKNVKELELSELCDDESDNQYDEEEEKEEIGYEEEKTPEILLKKNEEIKEEIKKVKKELLEQSSELKMCKMQKNQVRL